MSGRDSEGGVRDLVVRCFVGEILYVTCLLALLVNGAYSGTYGEIRDSFTISWVVTLLSLGGALLGWLLMGLRRPDRAPLTAVRVPGGYIALIHVIAIAVAVALVESWPWAMAVVVLSASVQALLLWWRLRGHGFDRLAWHLSALAAAAGVVVGACSVFVILAAGLTFGYFLWLLVPAAALVGVLAHVLGAFAVDSVLRRRAPQLASPRVPVH